MGEALESAEHECLKRIVRQEILKSNQCEDQGGKKMDTLAVMAIKVLMRKELLTDEPGIIKQVFKEPIGFLDEFCEVDPIWRPSSSTKESAQDHRLRSNGPLMFALLNQEIPRLYKGEIRIIVTRRTLQICVNGHFIADIPHRDGFRFDTFWANKFAKMIMCKYPEEISIELNGEGLPDHNVNSQTMGSFVKKTIIDKLQFEVPIEGFEKYISEERPLYFRFLNCFKEKINLCVRFSSHTVYFSNRFETFWGYIKED